LTVDDVSGEVGFGVGFPREVDRVSVSGDGGEAGGDPGGEGVAEEQGYGRGFGAAQLEGVAVEFDGADALGGVGVGFALLGGGVEGAAGVVCSLQMDLGRFGCGELEGLGGGGFRWGLLGGLAGAAIRSWRRRWLPLP
jgi:hypothetical protein